MKVTKALLIFYTILFFNINSRMPSCASESEDLLRTINLYIQCDKTRIKKLPFYQKWERPNILYRLAAKPRYHFLRSIGWYGQRIDKDPTGVRALWNSTWTKHAVSATDISLRNIKTTSHWAANSLGLSKDVAPTATTFYCFLYSVYKHWRYNRPRKDLMP